MIAKAKKYEGILRADGAGAFSHVEYDGDQRVVLRSSSLKTADMSGTVRLYFDGRRQEVMSGRRFDPMGGLWLLRPGMVYRIITNIDIVEPIPEGSSALVVVQEDAKDVLMIIDGPMREGFSGKVNFTIMPYRKIEMEAFTSVARLMFFEDTVNLSDEWLANLSDAVLARVRASQEPGNSDRRESAPKEGEGKKPRSRKST